MAIAAVSAGTAIKSLISAVKGISETVTFTQSLTAAFSGFSGAFLGVASAAAVAVAAFSAYSKSVKEARESAQEASEAWGESNDSLDDYISQIKELRDSLNSGTLSEEEAYEAKSELLTIQQELSDSYGNKVEGINLVNGAYEEQIGILENLSAEKAQMYLSDNEEQINKATNKIEGFEYSLGTYYSGTEIGDAIESIISQYSDYFDKRYTWDGGVELYFDANAEDAETILSDFKLQILDLQETTGNDSFLSGFYNNANSAIDSATDVLDKWQEIYDQAKEAEIIADDTPYTYQGTSQTASKWLSDYSKAIEAYNEALASGDEEAVTTAKEEYEFLNTALNGFSATLSRWAYDDAVAEISGELDEAAAAASDFKQELSDDAITDATGEIHTGLVETIKEAELSEESLTSIFDSMSNLGGDEAKNNPLLDGMDEEVSNALILIQGLAEDAGVSVEDLIAAFVELGIVASDVSTSVDDTTTFSSLFLDSEGEATEFSESIDTFQDEISDINDALDSLRTGEDVDFTDLVQEFPELAGQADNLEEALTNLSATKLEEFAQTWEESISTISDPDQIAAANEMFADLLKNMDLSEYIDATSAEKIYNHLFSVIANGRMDNGNARALVDQLMAEFGDSDAVLEAIVKLSANPDAANWTYEEWVAQIEDQTVDIDLRISEDTVENLQTDLEALESEADVLESEISLNEANGIRTTAEDYEALIKNSEEQVENLEDQNKELNKQKKLAIDAGDDYSDIQSQIDENTVAINSAKEAQIEWNESIQTLSYDNFKDGLDAVTEVLGSQQAGISIDYESFTSAELQDYRSALETVNGTMQLNVEKVNEIAEAKAEEAVATNDANKAMAQAEYKENAKEIQDLQKKLQTLTKGSYEYKRTLSQIQSLQSNNSAIAAQCTEYDLLTQSIYESISAYQDWVNIQDAADYGDMFNDTMEGYQLIYDTLFNSESDSYGNVGSLKYKAAIEMLAPEDLDDSELKEYFQTYFKDFFTFDTDDDGTITFDGMDVGAFLDKSVEEGLMTVENGHYEIAPDIQVSDFMESLNISETAVQAFFDMLGLKGGEFEWDVPESLNDLMVAAGEASNALQTLEGNEDICIITDVSDLESADEMITTLNGTIEQMNEIKAQPDVDASEIEYANAIIEYVAAQIQELNNPVVMSVDTSAMEDSEIVDAITSLQSLQEAENQRQINLAVGVDTEDADAAIESAMEEIRNQPEAMAKIGITVDENSDADSILSQLQNQTEDTYVSIGATVNSEEAESKLDEIANLEIEDKSFSVSISDSASPALQRILTRLQTLTGTTWNISTSTNQTASVNGTAHALGTAKADGDWGTQKSGNSLVGELGREIVVLKCHLTQ